MEKPKIKPVKQGDKGTAAARNINNNFENILDYIESLKAEIETLKKTAMIGNNGNGGVTEDAVVNISYNPLNVIARNDIVAKTYTVDVQVMCGNKELTVDKDDPSKFTYGVYLKDSIISDVNMIAQIREVISEDKKLSFEITVQPGAISDSDFTFIITYRGVEYATTVPIIVSSKESGFEYAQGVFMSTIFTRSDEDLSGNAPTGGTFEMPLPTTIDGDFRGAHQGWSDGIPAGSKPLWSSHRKFTNNGKKPQDATWSNPILAMDSADFDVCYTDYEGIPGEPERHGNQDDYNDYYGWHNIGTSGDTWMATSVRSGNEWGDWSILRIKGENGASSDWKNTIYKMSSTQPATPTSKTTDFIDNFDNISESDPNYGWCDMPNNNGIWWMSCAYVKGDTNRVDEDGWSTPVKVSGGSGQGVFVSTVFKRSSVKPDKPLATDGDFNEPVPDRTGWSDGIPSGSGPVWESHRTFTSDGQSPQDASWSEPKCMMDTADFDCCFCTSESVPTAPANSHPVQNDPNGWHDQGTSDDNWMATCYKSANGNWGNWVVTKIKGETGKDGDYTNYIFKEFNTNDTIEAPDIMTPENFIDLPNDEILADNGSLDTQPRNQGWKDGPGIGEKWYMSCAIIDGDTGMVDGGSGWSTPTKLNGENGEDGSYTEYEYAINKSEITPPDSNDDSWKPTVEEALSYLSDIEGITYSSVPSNHYMWMRFRRWAIPENGTVLEHGNWEYARVTGEKGESGTKLSVSGTKSSYAELFGLAYTSSGQHKTEGLPQDGESWVVNQELWVWSDASTWDDTANETKYGTKLGPAKWQNCGGIVGPPGETQYLHIKYAKVLDLETTDGKLYPSMIYNSPEDCRYIGTLADKRKEAQDIAPQEYTWAVFTGDDGYGYEYIYKLSKTDTPPDVPTEAECVEYKGKKFQDNDYVPSGWTDNASGISAEFPYEFMCKRVRENGKWKPFSGQASDNTKAILFSYMGMDAPKQDYEWGVFDTFVLTEEIQKSKTWTKVIPASSTYIGKCLWQRVRTITPAYGDTAETTSEWEYLRVSGEKGNEGTGISLKGSEDSIEKLFKKAYNNGVVSEANYNEKLINDGEAWTVSGVLWTWSVNNERITTPNKDYHNTIPQNHWRDGGQIKGESNYLHIKYADKVSIVNEEYRVDDNSYLTSFIQPNDGEKPGRFIGICYTPDKIDPDPIDNSGDNYKSPYKWEKFLGDDGLDYEIIYTRTATDKAPGVPVINNESVLNGEVEMSCVDVSKTDAYDKNGTPQKFVNKNYQEADFVPYTGTKVNKESITLNNWTDNPMGPTESLPYEWAAKRDKIDGKWTTFYGRADNTEYAFLFNKYGDSALELMLNFETYVYDRVSGSTRVKTEDLYNEIIVSKDGIIQEITSVYYDDDGSGNKKQLTTSGTSNSHFSSIKYVPKNTMENNANPMIYLNNKSSMDSGGKIKFYITVGGVEYTKYFSYSIGGKDGQKGDKGEDLVRYEIIPDRTTIKFDAANQITDKTNISVECYQLSGDTRTKVNWATLSGYTIKAQVDNGSPFNLQSNTQAGGDRETAVLLYDSYKTVNNQIKLTLSKSGNTCQIITIPVVKDGQDGQNSRGNLFGRESIIDINNGENNGNPIILPTKDGLIAIARPSSEGKIYLNIGDNPYEPRFSSNKHFKISAEIGIRKLRSSDSGNSGTLILTMDTSGNDVVNITNLSTTFNYHKMSQGTHNSGKISNQNPLIACTDLTTGTTYAIHAKNLKIEEVNSPDSAISPFDGLCMQHSVQNPNLLLSTSVFGKPFTGRTGTEMNCYLTPYEYCGNTSAAMTLTGATENALSFLSYKISGLKAKKYYTLSWYQYTNSSSGECHCSISNVKAGTCEDLVVCNMDDYTINSTKTSTITDTTHKNSDTNGWKKHTVTFYKTYTGTTDATITWSYGDRQASTCKIAMPKLEEGRFDTPWLQNDNDRTSKPLRGPMAWKEGMSYQSGGPSDDFQDLVTFGNANNMYLCKYSHTSSNANDPSHNVTSGWSTSTPWAVTSKVDFVASDVIWSDKLSSNVMNVVDGAIENLTVDKLVTNGNNATIEIKDGMMKIFGLGSTQPFITFGINSDGYAVMNYYDSNGNLLYNLGPTGILSKITETSPHYTEYQFYKIADNDSEMISNPITFKSSTTVYHWVQGVKGVGNYQNYTAGNGWREEPFENSGCYFASKGLTGEAPTNLLSDGYYVRNKPYLTSSNNSLDSYYDGYCDTSLEHFVNGKSVGNYHLKFAVQKDSNDIYTQYFYYAYEDGSVISNRVTLGEYIRVMSHS